MSTKTTKTAKSVKKPIAPVLTLCNKCGGEIFRSTFRNFGEVLMGPILLPYRCSRCGWRQFRSSFSRVRNKNDYRRAANDRE